MADSSKIVVLGGGESGVGAAVLAKKKGFEVFVSDKGEIKEEYKKVLWNNEIEWEEQHHSEERILAADEVIKSPGIPDHVPLIKQLREKGIPVISEIEFAARFTNAKMICITGSNGKTTTALITHHILKKAGLNVGLGGNVGDSLAKQVAEGDRDYFVVELSSFQLDGMFEFKADIAILINITPDHLDRYEYDFDKYVDSKFRIAQNQTSEDVFIYCCDDEAILKGMKRNKVNAQLIPFSIKQQLEQGAWLNKEDINIKLNKNDKLNMSIHDLALQGKHNNYNSMAAGVAARVLEIRKDIIRESLSDFQNIEHRLELVAKVHGIAFINDSKATNVNSTWYALESINTPIVWVVGGVDKGNDYSVLKGMVANKVKAIICLGKDNSKIIEAFKDTVDTIVETNTAQEAVAMGYRLGKKGETVLLSPACASFDLFENYEDRGQQFKNAVKAL
jgi:UDP-N-acetylmuramoylalanine--D-glutamate ligase